MKIKQIALSIDYITVFFSGFISTVPVAPIKIDPDDTKKQSNKLQLIKPPF